MDRIDKEEPDIFAGLRGGARLPESEEAPDPAILREIEKCSPKRKDAMDLDIFSGLKNIVGIECKSCGNINPSAAGKCEECGAPLEARKEDEEIVSVMHREGIPGAQSQTKISIEDARYLNLLKESVDKITRKAMTLEEYQNNVKIVLTVARVGVELFSTELMKEKVAALPEEQQQLINRTAALFGDYALGCTTMLQYDGSSNHSNAVKGLEMVTSALVEMDRIQDRAIEIEAAEKEARWAGESRAKNQEAPGQQAG